MKLTLPKPPTTNHIYGITSRGGFARMYITKEGKAWFAQAKQIIKETIKTRKPITVPCEVSITVYTSTQRDTDGSTKPILDALEENGIVENDRLFTAVLAYRERCKKQEDRVEIEIMGY
jgi:Holliday junction resolvase RusA-like endonuclease